MHINLSGKTAIVTGSTRGIGRAIALGLAGAGASVVVTGRQQADVERAVAGIRQAVPGADVRGVAADLGTAAGFQLLQDAEPRADILVNNIGIFGPQPFADIADQEWTRFFELNIMSGVRASRAYLPGMQRRDWGRIVFISSESALNIPADMIHYGFTKTGNLAISRGLAKSLAGTGITVNAVLPGPTLSEGVHHMVAPGADHATAVGVANAFVREHRSSSILQRVATPEEVANMVVYVCSPQASATTGAALRVDGGVVDSIA
ncbi:SDR family NAD(P)-dependent oxidoreductase [Janthinobacterium agaricidamnosum]|uniref:Short chain dehydrogenase family protein n=1 Tax=Janthinobacterium agaricidamnosum NBRC 102515 = DSM 9628 TaxID=1349767 RepID=W0VF47_9BURK|nr:SDR family oxidoreductase [Janthinobacterium agaricidamnosum]CDG85962.1 short chain dehydrogenase family protein [Janthinobacterium agaricidamnosum NBRC 102515 = DSM 9628]